MAKGPTRIKGTQDIWGESADRFQAVLAAFDHVSRIYNFQHVEIPVFEATEVFRRSIGETTDIVSKEMYTFVSQGDESLTLRPEFTAGIARAYLSEGWQQIAPVKVAASGPVFRYESPQAGRYRQFHQLDAEIIGTPSPNADVELLVFANQLLHELGIAEDITLQLNTLGDADTRAGWRAALVAHFEAHRGDLSKESLVRLEKNPLRILDSKEACDRPIADSAPGIDDYLSSEAGAFFEAVVRGLDAASVSWTRNARLVRGLDYYRHTAFEFVTDRLGAQGTVLAGGRYDGLIESLGGPSTPAVGWAAGIERLGMMIDLPDAHGAISVVPDKPELEAEALALTVHLRRQGITVDNAFQGNAKRRVEVARKKNLSAVLILRDEAQQPRLHLTHYTGTDDQKRQLAQTILGSVQDLYPGGLSGGGLQ